jgi:hypothetical protein
VKDEVSEFKVTLINPFGFDLELQNIVLRYKAQKDLSLFAHELTLYI